MTWALGEGCSFSGEVSHLGTLSCEDKRQTEFSPTELTEKAYLVHATWKTIPNSLVFRVLKHQVVNSYHEKERRKFLTASFNFRKVCVDREERNKTLRWIDRGPWIWNISHALASISSQPINLGNPTWITSGELRHHKLSSIHPPTSMLLSFNPFFRTMQGSEAN